MKKTLFKSVSIITIIAVLLVLVGCGGISSSYADKINKAAEDGEYISLEDVRKKLGDSTSEVLVLNTGVAVWASGCDNSEELQAKFDAGKTVKVIMVYFAAGKAAGANYGEYSQEQFEQAKKDIVSAK